MLVGGRPSGGCQVGRPRARIKFMDGGTKLSPKTNSLLKGKMWEIMDGVEMMPEWMVKCKTMLISKEGCAVRAYQFSR